MFTCVCVCVCVSVREREREEGGGGLNVQYDKGSVKKTATSDSEPCLLRANVLVSYKPFYQHEQRLVP